jgi:hypothetical protein
MSFWRPMAAIAALALCGTSYAAYPADTGVPRRSVEERPFGGPPPQRRSMGEKWGTSCKTPSATCKLAKSQKVGSDCSCPGSDGKSAAGVIEDSK